MNIELYQLAKTGHKSYESLGSIQSDATPVKGSFIFYSDKYFEVDMVVISKSRIVAFVKSVNGSELGIERVFQM